MRRVGVLTQRRRWFSSASNDTSQSVGAGAVQKKGWSRYALVGIPLAILGVVVTDIVCNVNHRKALEKRLPTFVRLVREHYGFDDEDPRELARVNMVKQENMKPVDVTIQLRDGTVVQLRGVNGAKSVRELAKEAAHQSGDGDLWDQLDLLDGVEFTADSRATSPDNGQGNENSAGLKPAATTTSSTVVSLDQGTWGMLRSFWESLPDSSNTANPVRSSSFGAAAGSGERSPAQALLRFENACADLAEGLHSYAAYGTLFPVFTDGQMRHRPRGGYQTVGAAQQRQQPQKQKQASEAEMARVRAKKRVEDLERAIALLREEQRRGSSREVDAVEADIRAKQQEIAELRRKHLNYFYYF